METTPEHRIPPYHSSGLSNGSSPLKPVKKAKMFIVRSRRAQTLCPCVAENIGYPLKSASFKRKSVSPVIPTVRFIKKRLLQKATQTGEENSILNRPQSVTESITNYENDNVSVAYQTTSKREYMSTASQTEEPHIAVVNLSDKHPGNEYIVVKNGMKKPTIKKVRSRRRASTLEPTTVENFLNIVKLIRTDAIKEAERVPSVKEPVATSPEPITVEAFKKQTAKKWLILPEPLPQPANPEVVQKHDIPKQPAAKKHVNESPQRICLVPGCPTELKLPRPPGMRYHCLPTDLGLRKKYLSVCGRNRNISVTGFVCGKHFKRDDYEANGTLKKEALPSVNMQHKAVTSTPPRHTPRKPTPVRRTHISWDELVSPGFRPPEATNDDCSNWNVSLTLENCVQFVRLRLQPLTIGQYDLPYSVVDLIQIFRDLSVYLWTDDWLIPVDMYLNKLTENAQGGVSVLELKKLFEFDFAGCESRLEISTTATS